MVKKLEQEDLVIFAGELSKLTASELASVTGDPKGLNITVWWPEITKLFASKTYTDEDFVETTRYMRDTVIYKINKLGPTTKRSTDDTIKWMNAAGNVVWHWYCKDEEKIALYNKFRKKWASEFPNWKGAPVEKEEAEVAEYVPKCAPGPSTSCASRYGDVNKHADNDFLPTDQKASSSAVQNASSDILWLGELSPTTTNAIDGFIRWVMPIIEECGVRSVRNWIHEYDKDDDEDQDVRDLFRINSKDPKLHALEPIINTLALFAYQTRSTATKLFEKGFEIQTSLAAFMAKLKKEKKRKAEQVRGYPLFIQPKFYHSEINNLFLQHGDLHDDAVKKKKDKKKSRNNEERASEEDGNKDAHVINPFHLHELILY